MKAGCCQPAFGENIRSLGGMRQGAVTVSQGSHPLYRPNSPTMQGNTFEDKVFIGTLRATLSEARFDRYVQASNGDPVRALQLYHWNAKLSQSLYFPLQMWEVALRNKLNSFLCWKFNASWPFDRRALRQLTHFDRRRVQEAVERLERRRRVIPVSTNAVVADLSAGFWVALFNQDYEIPFSWRYNLVRIFTAEPGLATAEVRLICNDLLYLRNRVAHHEPIYHLPLPQRRAELDRLVAAMCPSAFAFVNSACTFEEVWKSKP